MYGAVLGDIIGSTYELHNVKSENIELFPVGSTFTDDTVLSVAVAEKILNEQLSQTGSKKSYALWFKQRSYGNGAAMRVASIGFAYNDIDTICKEVKSSCYYTHHHREAVKGAQAVATAIFMGKKDCSKEEMIRNLEKKFSYSFDFTLDEIREQYVFDSRTSYTVPVAIKAFIESESYEDAIRKAISIGGDSDTIACMTGGIAQAYYKEIPKEIFDRGYRLLDSGLKRVLNEFEERYEVRR